jgi:hypothetical protein
VSASPNWLGGYISALIAVVLLAGTLALVALLAAVIVSAWRVIF